MIEPWGKHARVLKGLEHYYGANPYDTFQASRALDAVGLHAEARELLRHQLEHLKADGLFEMWETGDLARRRRPVDRPGPGGVGAVEPLPG